jgi:beta-barrel assembly-enhancing protease
MRKLKMIALAPLFVLLSGCAMFAALLSGDWGTAIAEFTKIAAAAIQDLADGKVAEEYAPSQEYYIGRGVSAAVVDAYPPADLNDPNVQRQIVYLNELGGFVRESSFDVTRDGAELGGHVSRDAKAIERIENLTLFRGLHVGLLATDEVCAFATPGGFIWISMGAIAMCQTEDELAAIICHELGHIMMNHGMDQYRQANQGGIADSRWAQAAFGDDNELFAQFGRLITSFADDLISSGYSRDQELEADNWGTRALAASGFDPSAMETMLKRVREYELARGGGGGGYLANHPDIDERIKAVQELIRAEGDALRIPGADDGQDARNQRFREMFGN